MIDCAIDTQVWTANLKEARDESSKTEGTYDEGGDRQKSGH